MHTPRPIWQGNIADDRVYSTKEVAAHLGVAVQTVTAHYHRGNLKATRDVLGRFKFLGADVRGYISRNNGVIIPTTSGDVWS